MTDILGPASINAVTVRPARTNIRGDADTWYIDCSAPGAGDGSRLTADWLNDVLAQLRVVFSSSGIDRNNADDMLWRAIRSVGLRYAAAGGAADALTAAFAPPIPAYYDGLPLLVKAAADCPGPVTLNCDGKGARDIKTPAGDALTEGAFLTNQILFLVDDGAQFQLVSVLPAQAYSPKSRVGEIIMWPLEAAPSHALECAGQAVSRATYATLFGKIGTSYGTGDGTTTFNLPDYRGYFLRGWAHGQAADPDRATRTDRGDGTTGDHVGTAQSDALIQHQHNNGTVSIPGSSTADVYGNPGILLSEGGVNQNIGSDAGTQQSVPGYKLSVLRVTSGTAGNSVETRPKNKSVMVCIIHAD